MRISSINTTSYNTQKNTNNQSFKGLWGENVEKYCGGKEIIFETYYPFLDETDKEIAKVHASYQTETASDNDEDTFFQDRRLLVKDRLPIERKEWEQYIKNPFVLGTLTRSYVEQTLDRYKIDFNHNRMNYKA